MSIMMSDIKLGGLYQVDASTMLYKLNVDGHELRINAKPHMLLLCTAEEYSIFATRFTFLSGHRDILFMYIDKAFNDMLTFTKVAFTKID